MLVPPHVAVFPTWAIAALLGYVVVCRIVRRPQAITLDLAAPFSVLKVLGGQSRALTACLCGAEAAAGVGWVVDRLPWLQAAIIGRRIFATCGRDPWQARFRDNRKWG